MGLAHEKKSYLQEKANLFEIGSIMLIQPEQILMRLPLIFKINWQRIRQWSN